MIFVDSSVWIDFFRGVSNAETARLRSLLGQQIIVTGDVVLTEILQGFDQQAHFDTALRLMRTLPIIDIGGTETAIQAARNFRFLRARGITVRKTIDTLIATRCIIDGLPLLHRDRDFDPFVAHLGLVSAMA